MGKCPHCPSCGKKKSCGNHHVYVIELKEEVLDDPAFCPDRPSNAGPHSKCYYVGETKHRVDCRFTQHRAKKRRRKKEGATFDCTCKTGKVVKVEFDPKIISYENIIKLFFKFHDPTTLNRQGPNVGYQYRSEIFYKTTEEKNIAEKVLKEMNEKFDGKIVTKISKEKNYCKAEEYHQKYFQKNH